MRRGSRTTIWPPRACSSRSRLREVGRGHQPAVGGHRVGAEDQEVGRCGRCRGPGAAAGGRTSATPTSWCGSWSTEVALKRLRVRSALTNGDAVGHSRGSGRWGCRGRRRPRRAVPLDARGEPVGDQVERLVPADLAPTRVRPAPTAADRAAQPVGVVVEVGEATRPSGRCGRARAGRRRRRGSTVTAPSSMVSSSPQIASHRLQAPMRVPVVVRRHRTSCHHGARCGLGDRPEGEPPDRDRPDSDARTIEGSSHGIRTRRLPAALGLILAFAVQDAIDAIDLTMIGCILAARRRPGDRADRGPGQPGRVSTRRWPPRPTPTGARRPPSVVPSRTRRPPASEGRRSQRRRHAPARAVSPFWVARPLR